MIKPPRLLICLTLIFLIVFSGSIFYFARAELPDSISLDTKNQPTIGYPKARVHVVVFEEPKCSHCREYNNDIFPQIKKEFIDTNKIQYTVIPVSFMPGSMPAAISILCVYNENTRYPNGELALKYLDYLYLHQPSTNINWATSTTLVDFAKNTSPAIDLNRLKQCVDTEAYRVSIEQNTDYGKAVMGGKVFTPTVYVNGIQVKEISLEEIRKLINEVLEHEGVY